MSGLRSYVLNGEDRICQTGGNWDQFAVENDGPGAVTSQVVGRSIWDFIGSHDVQSYMNALYFAARQKNSVVSLPYRCDSPNQPRLIMMRIVPIEKRGLIVEHNETTLAIAPRDGVPIPLMAHYSDKKCSVCCSIEIGNEWIDTLVRPLTSEFPKGLGLCQNCKKMAALELSRISGKNKVDRVLRFSAS